MVNFVYGKEEATRTCKYDFFLVFDAILYVDKTGCQWRNLPHDFQAWQTVYYYFRAWSAIGEFKNLLDSLVAEVRFQEGQTPEPSVAVVDFIALTITAPGGSFATSSSASPQYFNEIRLIR
ncbi:transposase [Muribaculaceae bacterium Isolate-113 (HZI)]|uniref:transposase n=1 Tax=Sangeribacter muris TaxID=2880703 RepID=UPI000F47DF08|nr:transposase [Sangeribacter muris]ROT19872.1 transposase [Muribaculaceae bacterium Isolate-113 (HZI)]ROT21106.1 transposase [Muribaculaceae bacterium Isolate-114 (HZI)]RXE65706.1 transposase [Muribaculaceae bacterium Isolate-001 (NCI)]